MLAADELGQVLGSLLRRAIALDLVDAEVAVRAVRQAHRSRGARDFFHGNHVGQIAHVGTAIFLAHGNAQHAQSAHLLPQVHGELVGAVYLGGARCDLFLGKGVHCVAQCVNVFAELEIESG